MLKSVSAGRNLELGVAHGLRNVDKRFEDLRVMLAGIGRHHGSRLASVRMPIRLVTRYWDRQLADALATDHSSVRIVVPFIKRRAAERLLEAGVPAELQVITRFNLANFVQGVSDIAALRLLLANGAVIRGLKNLHAKLYLSIRIWRS